VNYNKDLVLFWYPTLWIHKTPYRFYQVQSAFLSMFKKMIDGSSTQRLSNEATIFLTGKGSFEVQDRFSYIRLYGFQGKSLLLPYCFSDKFFIIEVCKKYKSWAYLFNEKRKKQFIPFPLKVREVIVKNISHLDKFVVDFDLFKMISIHEFQGFDPNGSFTEHIFNIGYGSYFIKSLQLDEGGGDNQKPQEKSPKSHLDDVDTLISTDDQYKQRGRTTTSGNPSSPHIPLKMSSTTQSKAHGNNLEKIKSLAGNFGSIGDKEHPKKAMEKSHT
jgi:hypothetical protein